MIDSYNRWLLEMLLIIIEGVYIHYCTPYTERSEVLSGDIICDNTDALNGPLVHLTTLISVHI